MSDHRRSNRPGPRYHIALLLMSLVLAIAPAAEAADDREQRDLVDQSRMTLTNFLADSNMSWFREHIKDAKGLFIVPQFLKAALFYGGAGGSGVFVARDEKQGYGANRPFLPWGPPVSDFSSAPRCRKSCCSC